MAKMTLKKWKQIGSICGYDGTRTSSVWSKDADKLRKACSYRMWKKIAQSNDWQDAYDFGPGPHNAFDDSEPRDHWEANNIDLSGPKYNEEDGEPDGVTPEAEGLMNVMEQATTDEMWDAIYILFSKMNPQGESRRYIMDFFETQLDAARKRKFNKNK